MPLLDVKTINQQFRLGIWKVEESIDDLQAKLILNNQELDFFHNLKKGKRNFHWLAGRVLLRKLLQTNDFIEVKEDEFGKPFLVNFKFEISITHSYDYAGVIIGPNQVGIDIEKIKKDLSFLAPKFLSDDEIKDLNGDNLLKKLYVFWCVKESLYKLYGKKELSFKNNIIVKPFKYHSPGKLEVVITKNNYCKQYEVYYEEFVPGYMMAYCIS